MESVGGVVGPLDRLLQILVGIEEHHRCKHLVDREAAPFWRVGHHGGVDHRTLAFTAHQHLGSGTARLLDPLGDASRRVLGHEGADVGGGVQRVTHPQPTYSLHEQLGEVVQYVAVDVDPLHRVAALTVVGEPPAETLPRRQVEIGIPVHQVGRVAAQLEEDPPHTCRPQHRLTGFPAAGEGDEAHRGVLDQRLCDLRPTRHHVDEAGRQAGLVEDLRQPQRGEAGGRSRFDHHGVAGSHPRTQFVCHQVERGVERGDGGDHPDRLAHAVGEEALPIGSGIRRIELPAEGLGRSRGRPQRPGHPAGLTEGVLDDLARRPRDDVRQFPGVLGRQVGGAAQDCGAFVDRELGGGRRRGRGAADRLGDDFGVGQANAGHDLAAIGLDDVDFVGDVHRPTADAGTPFPGGEVDQLRPLTHCFRPPWSPGRSPGGAGSPGTPGGRSRTRECHAPSPTPVSR